MIEAKCEELKEQLLQAVPGDWSRILYRSERDGNATTFNCLCDTGNEIIECYQHLCQIFPKDSTFDALDRLKPSNHIISTLFDELISQDIKVIYFTLDKSGKYELEIKKHYDFVGDDDDRFALWRYQYMDFDKVKKRDRERICKYFTEEQIAQGIKVLPDLEEKRKEYELSEKMRTRGRDMIYETFDNLYHKKPFDCLAPMHHWKATGKDPLEVVEMYDAGDYWHFVSLGLSELYEKVSDDPEISGFGMELTFKLKKDDSIGFDEEKEAIYNNMQIIATAAYIDGMIFKPYEYIYTEQTDGIDYNHKSNLVGFITIPDPSVAPMMTPNGKVEFIELIGVTKEEMDKLINKELTVKELYEQLGTDITDYSR